ncbi:hypothetical protein HDV00_007509 [Rhizophlyctis rosea]|nr:hypothetical protein HDV00_007509 [Rhizophlyctis rosea]
MGSFNSRCCATAKGTSEDTDVVGELDGIEAQLAKLASSNREKRSQAAADAVDSVEDSDGTLVDAGSVTCRKREGGRVSEGDVTARVAEPTVETFLHPHYLIVIRNLLDEQCLSDLLKECTFDTPGNSSHSGWAAFDAASLLQVSGAEIEKEVARVLREKVAEDVIPGHPLMSGKEWSLEHTLDCSLRKRRKPFHAPRQTVSQGMTYERLDRQMRGAQIH